MNLASVLFGCWFRASTESDSHFDPLSKFWYGTIAPRTSSGVSVNEQTALIYSAVWAATRLLSGSAGSLPLNLYRRVGEEGRKIARDHAAHWLLHTQPNPEMMAMPFRSFSVAQQVNIGNAFAEIQRDENNNAVALWPIQPSRVRIFRDAKDDQIIYEVRNAPGKAPSFIPFADMLHVPSIITDDGIWGKGVIQHARESIGFGLATERHGAQWFGSGGIPRIVIEHPRQWTEEARAQWRKEWKEIYSGTDGSMAALLTGGATVKPIMISNEDSQFLGSRQHNVEEIARWYGIPPHLLQHLMRSTFNNIEVQGIEFVVYSLMHWLVIWEQVLAAKVLRDDERREFFFEHNVNGLMRGDAKSRAAFYRTLHTIGALSANEVRKLENLNPVEGLDTYFVQGAMAPIANDGSVAEPVGADQFESNLEKINEALSKEMEISLESLRWHHRVAVGVDLCLHRMTTLNDRLHEVSSSLQPAVDSLNRNLMTSFTVPKDLYFTHARNFFIAVLDANLEHETTFLISAAGRPRTFLSEVEDFYSRHEESLAAALENPCAFLSALATPIDPVAAAKRICEIAKKEIIELSGTTTAAQLKAAVEKKGRRWRHTRSQRMAGILFNPSKGANHEICSAFCRAGEPVVD